MNFLNYKNSVPLKAGKKILIVTAVTIVVLFALALLRWTSEEAMALDTGLDATMRAAQLPNETSLAKVIGQIIYAILGFLGIVFILLLIYGGFLRMTAQGDPGKIKTSYGIITSAVIGVIIILASYTITAFVLSQIGASVGTSGGGGDGGGFTQTGSCVVDEGPMYGKECWNNLTIDECSTSGKCNPNSGSCVSGSCTCSWNTRTCEERGFVGK